MKMNERYKELAIEAAVKAGRAILEIYNSPFKVSHKADHSPLTTADLASNAIILEHLKKTQVPILSEESAIPDYEVRKHWNCCWIVDPLDGTKEFIKKNGEFTVNIAYVERGKPTFGVIFIPVSQELYVGDVAKKEMRKMIIDDNILPTDIMEKGDVYTTSTSTSTLLSSEPIKAGERKKTIKVATSRSHLNEKTKTYLKELEQQYDTVVSMPKGSSLKFCDLAEGLVDIYPRFSPCMEWDVAAGQAICESAGVMVQDLQGALPMYNKENLYSSDFIFSVDIVL